MKFTAVTLCAQLTRDLLAIAKFLLKRRLHIAIGMQTRLQCANRSSLRLHRATGLHTGMHTGFANQASEHCLLIWSRPLASLRKQYLQPADGRGQHVLIYIYNK